MARAALPHEMGIDFNPPNREKADELAEKHLNKDSSWNRLRPALLSHRLVVPGLRNLPYSRDVRRRPIGRKHSPQILAD
jgi:hypothetical protein